MEYEEFIKSKNIKVEDSGFVVHINDINPQAFEFQKDIVVWAVKRGKAAVFADTGLGKTLMQLEWLVRIGGTGLIIAPLAVTKQTKREGVKFGYCVNIVEEQSDIKDGINITNYEKLHKFDLSVIDAIVLDESSILKSQTGKYRAWLIKETKDIKYKLACTATPAPNDYMELGNHSEFLGELTAKQMLSIFFINDCQSTQKWRLKGHSIKKFWEWVASWAAIIYMPSDLGYEDDGFELPELNVIHHVVETNKILPGFLFPKNAETMTERRNARKCAINKKISIVKKIIKSHDGVNLIWCDYNKESESLSEAIGDSTEIRGADTEKHKADAMIDFADGKIKTLITKPQIAGHGMNWQVCNVIVFFGLSDSFERYYQAIRRCWRFGQTKEVTVHIVTADIEGNVVKNINEKEARAMSMRKFITESTQAHVKANLKEVKPMNIIKKTDVALPGWVKSNGNKSNAMTIDQVIAERYAVYHGDSVEVIKAIPDNTIGCSIFSPPFPELYTYSDDAEDIGNSITYEECLTHFGYLVPDLMRIIKPGRSIVIHCGDTIKRKSEYGYIGARDFPGDIIRLFESIGMVYHSRITIWKDPLIEVTRTKALGLMHKQLVKDSAICRAGLPDVLIVMRKPGENSEPISHIDGLTEFEYFGSKPPNVSGIKRQHHIWQKYASPVWMDIRQTKTLQKNSARDEKDEKHICPLQLDTIARAILLWSNPEDIVFSPFAGIGSEIYQAVAMGRRGIGIELKGSYYKQARLNLKHIAMLKTQRGLFDNK